MPISFDPCLLMRHLLGEQLKMYRDNVDSVIQGIRDLNHRDNTTDITMTTQPSHLATQQEEFVLKKLRILDQGVENLRLILSLIPTPVVEGINVSVS